MSAALMAVLSLSVPQEVKISSPGSQPKRVAILDRASSICMATAPPKECMELGLPYFSAKNGSMAATISGATWLVALLSM
jgi:hypothetical protein